MRATFHRVLAVAAALTIALATLGFAGPASAAGAADPVYPFAYTVNATTHLKKLNQTITVPPGSFTGGIDLANGRLVGKITLPPASFTLKLAGLVPAATATAVIVPTKPVTGHVDLSTFAVTATSTFNIRIVSAYATGVHINLVGTRCATATPISVTMKGTASLGAPSTLSGTFTMPSLANCGLATTALNLVIPGPGNTFTALATPT